MRLLKNSIKNFEINNRLEVGDDDTIKILRKEIKQRKESIAEFTKGGRQDLAAKEQAEISIIEKYLPAALSEAETTKIIDSIISNTGASEMKDMGKVIGLAMKQLGSSADGGLISAIVKSRLSNQ